MAEGWMKHLHGSKYAVYSAGLEAQGLNPMATLAMSELGVDISHQKSTRVDAFEEIQFDYVVTVCDHANQHCPTLPPESEHFHRPFDDPPALAKSMLHEQAQLDCYKRVSLEIRNWLEDFPPHY